MLERVASGLAWEAIVEEWRGSVSHPPIAEAVRLASESFAERPRQGMCDAVPT